MKQKIISIFLMLSVVMVIGNGQYLYCNNVYVHGTVKDLGTLVRGNSTLYIRGKLLAVSDNTTEPIVKASVYLYLNKSSNESYLLATNKTDDEGVFIFKIFVARDFPLGEVYFTVIYLGDLLRGYAPAKFYYKANIVESNSGGIALSEEAIAILIVFSLMMLSGVVLSIKRLTKSRLGAKSFERWLELLDTISEKVDKKDFSFIALVGDLIDSLLRKFGIVPPLDATIQKKLLLIRENLDDEAFNILKNMVSLYELYMYGGPYAKTVLMNTLDFSVWKKLIAKLKQLLQ